MCHREEFAPRSTIVGIEGFSPSVAGILTSVDGEEYIPLFRKFDVSIRDVSEMTETDLIILGIDSAQVRRGLIDAGKELPVVSKHKQSSPQERLTDEDVQNILTNSYRHLHMIFLSLMEGRVSLLKCTDPSDTLLKCNPERYATDIISESIIRAKDVSRKRDIELTKLNTSRVKNKRKKKTWIALLGGTVIVLLSIGLVKSLKES